MITIENAKATAQMLVNRYTDLTNAEEIVRKAIQEEIVNQKDALAIWGRVRNITKN
jgi:cobalamin biosynthesis protein CobD/CbiB